MSARRKWGLGLGLFAVVLVGGALLARSSHHAGASGPVLPPPGRGFHATATPPIDPDQLTRLPFGTRSHWVQPWRAYLDTPPASRLRDAIGINFNVTPAEADATARLLRANGFRRARYEIPWNQMDYMHPDRLALPDAPRQVLLALHRHGLRPLILLNANDLGPTPAQALTLSLRHAVPSGARQVTLDRTSAQAVVDGRTGFDGLGAPGRQAAVLITHVDKEGVATLSRPLPNALPAGGQVGHTLRYAPFSAPRLPGGAANPSYASTRDGWLTYVGGVTRFARRIVGSDAFDVEVWNEISNGSAFLDAANYYGSGPTATRTAVTNRLLADTVRYLRDPRHGVPHVGIGDGFASQSPFPAGSTVPRGVSALSKHPYHGAVRFPSGALVDTIAPLDALERPSFTLRGVGDAAAKVDSFTPTYTAFLPEYFLTGIQTETMVRDLAPNTNSIFGTLHGRAAHPPDALAPGVWMTEMNIDLSGSDPMRPGAPPGPLRAPFTPSETAHLQAKAALRTYVAYVSKGVSAVHLFAAKDPRLGLVTPTFFSRIDASGQYPGDHAGGTVLDAIRRLVATLGPPQADPPPRPLSLLQVASAGDRRQFDGDGTAAHPPLFDRDVLAFLPFQVSEHRWVIPTYVMTRNVARIYRPGAVHRDGQRTDLPAEGFRLVIGGVHAASARVRAFDPLADRSVPARIVHRSHAMVTVEVMATDSPRTLVITDR